MLSPAHTTIALLLAAALVVPSAAEASPLRLGVEIDAASTCPRPSQVLFSLRRKFGRSRVHLGTPAADELALRLIAPRPGELRAVLSDDAGFSLERTLRFTQGDCAEIPQTLALLVDAWLEQRPAWQMLRPAGAPQGDDLPAAEEADLPPAPTPKAARRSETRPTKATSEQASTRPEPPPAEAALVATAASTAPAIEPPPPPASAEHPLRLEMELTGGPAIGSSGSQLAAETLGRIGFLAGNRWGLSLEAGWEGPLRERLGPGEVSASCLIGGIAARGVLGELAGGRWDLVGALFGSRLAATATGYSEDGSTILWDAGAAVGLFWRRPLAAGLSLLAGPRVSLRLHEETLTVGNVESGMVVGTPRFSLGIGLGWDPS